MRKKHKTKIQNYGKPQALVHSSLRTDIYIIYITFQGGCGKFYYSVC